MSMRRHVLGMVVVASTMLLSACNVGKPVAVRSLPPPADHCDNGARVIHAEVVALDQAVTYNRFGSFNPYAMIYALKRDVVSTDGGELRAGEVRLRDGHRPRPLVLRGNEGDCLKVTFTNLLRAQAPDLSSQRWAAPYAHLNEPHEEEAAEGETPSADARGDGNWPQTRRASLVVDGLTPIYDPDDHVGDDPARRGGTMNHAITGIEGIAPGQSITYTWTLRRVGAHMFYSNAAPAGGQGDGGSLVHGLFGLVAVQPRGSRWYRSQVDAPTLARAWGDGTRLQYDATDDDGMPLLGMLRKRPEGGLELVRGDLTAVIVSGDGAGDSYREFSVVFHDELKTFYAEEFQALEEEGQLAGVRDTFAINYGASGMGAILLANRQGIGPGKDCVECMYEEFFLQSWVNGDPALLPAFEDDPSNVYHSYLGDRVKFLNAHAGPKETHVFHLHAHQWMSRDGDDGSYLDSQTIAPLQTFSYEIHWGGGGNRNLTPGDSIFHCHLYPHFAQGMWGLWRVHDVLEDGTRRLPDGELGAGTDAVTGQTAGGTPIPAIVPLPNQAMPPRPSYGDAGMPGYPFYIAATPGHRAPQAPGDIAESGGLGRHVVTGGTRRFADLSLPQTQSKSAAQLLRHALDTGDFTGALVTAELALLPEDGTPLEKRAMSFHAGRDPVLNPTASGVFHYPALTPEGKAAKFSINGLEPVPGAPFADPCIGVPGGTEPPIRNYHVSAIQTQLIVNKDGWHDPQARINVLDSDVEKYERRPTADAKPFYFRAHSNDCINFFHTNRTDLHTELDDFQVRTPTDVIGQHIHLVKFDVTASDGSGNGFNYEDGTFARDALLERIEASHQTGGSATDWDGNAVHLAPKLGADGERMYQTTVQRWWADPLLVKGPGGSYDQTIRTVFTHDHFGPSTIQQHGFYSALLVEPEGSRWLTPSGKPMCDGMDGEERRHGGRDLPPRACHEPVGSQAIIRGIASKHLQPDHREFAVAIADFALLYDGNEKNRNHHDRQGMYGLVSREDCRNPNPAQKVVCEHAEKWRSAHGAPIAPPEKPESISVEHHDPYLVNYRHEPLPLRLGKRDSSGSVREQKSGAHGYPAHAFSSAVHGGDPATEVFEAYEGEQIQFRVIQGAQEVQHMFTLHGLRWPREPRVDDAAKQYVSAQEIGISEHFEMELPPLPNVGRGSQLRDFLYSFGTVDALWNGAWGLLRVYDGEDAIDPTPRSQDDCDPASFAAAWLGSEPPADRKPCTRTIGGDVDERRLAPVSALAARSREVSICPAGAIQHTFLVQARQSSAGLTYDAGNRVVDPDGLFFDASPTSSAELGQCPTETGNAPEPMVLRLRAGECAIVRLKNCLPDVLRDARGDARMPKIVPMNVEPDAGGRQLAPGNRVSLHSQVIAANLPGVLAGLNLAEAGVEGGIALPGEGAATYHWYAGQMKLVEGAVVHTPVEYGATALTSFADPVQHGPAGLIGALIVEPADAIDMACIEAGASEAECLQKPLPSGIEAHLKSGSRGIFREFTIFYRDGLNLWRDGKEIRMHERETEWDSYDQGEQGVNYSSAAFRPRLGVPDHANLNQHEYPVGFYAGHAKTVPTPTFRAQPGEQVVFRVLHPSGRARQHSFIAYGHDYPDLHTGLGSPGSALVSVGKNVNAWLDTGAATGNWLYRDGIGYGFGGGIWGEFCVGPDDAGGRRHVDDACPAPDMAARPE